MFFIKNASWFQKDTILQKLSQKTYVLQEVNDKNHLNKTTLNSKQFTVYLHLRINLNSA